MKKHITALDGLRGIAILLVLVRHLLVHRPAGSMLMRAFYGVEGLGWAGVDLFFVLSGFLITGILYRAKGSAFYLRNFYMRRSLRIMPLYVLVLTCCMVLFPHFAATQGSAPVANRWMFWTYLSNVLVTFRGNVSQGWLGPTWSLAVEEHFYLVWPVVILLSSRKTALRICGTCVVLANISRILFLMHHNIFGPYFFTLSRIDELALGGSIALLLTRPDGVALVKRFAWPIGVASGSVTCALGIWRHGLPDDPIMLGLGIPAVGLFSASLVALAVLPRTAELWKRLLSGHTLRMFGRYSYGLYLLHMPVWELMSEHHLLSRKPTGLADMANMTAASAVTFLLAVISFHFFERYFLGLKRFFPEDTRQSAQLKPSASPAQRTLSLGVQP